MFTDLIDSTAMSAQVGDRRWVQILSDHFDLVRQIVERAGGTVVKTLGDGAMMAFGSANSALEAAISIQRGMVGSELQVRIGLHSGDSMHKEGDYFGTAVNKAARISGVASGGEIVVSSVTAELAGRTDVALGPPRMVTLKGLDGSHVVRGVLWSSG
jgi:class 3 adenylate cyclase